MDSIKGLADLHAKASGEEAVVIRAAQPGDAAGIEACYRRICLCPGREPLDCLYGFPMRGGMFQIPTRQEITAECEPERPRFAVACEQGGIAAIMRLDTAVSAYDRFVQARPGLLHYVELVIRSGYRHFAYPFLYANFRQLAEAGYDGAVFQIYHLLSWETEKETRALGLDNRPSLRLHEKIGAVRLGSLSPMTLAYGRAKLHIRPDVYYLALESSVDRLSALCRNTGWEVAFCENTNG